MDRITDISIEQRRQRLLMNAAIAKAMDGAEPDSRVLAEAAQRGAQAMYELIYWEDAMLRHLTSEVERLTNLVLETGNMIPPRPVIVVPAGLDLS